MNANVKKKMYNHYRDLGWSDADIHLYGTGDLTGEKPQPAKEAKKEKEVKEDKK